PASAYGTPTCAQPRHDDATSVARTATTRSTPAHAATTAAPSHLRAALRPAVDRTGAAVAAGSGSSDACPDPPPGSGSVGAGAAAPAAGSPGPSAPGAVPHAGTVGAASSGGPAGSFVLTAGPSVLGWSGGQYALARVTSNVAVRIASRFSSSM